MGNNSWVVENLNNALATWNGKLQEIWQLLLTFPEAFRGGSIWGIIVNVHDALKATGFALLVWAWSRPQQTSASSGGRSTR